MEPKNPHAGSSFDSFLEEELTKEDLLQLEELAKKCPRCGGASATKSNPSGRCSACLKKLKTAKKTPGHWQRAQTKADDALRRQDGKNGTASHKSSGRGSRASIVKQTQSAEKKTGEKLSPDRKNNSKGYAAKNTRMVPEKLNRGRHHVDPKKLRAWKKRLKKSDLDMEFFYTALLAKATQDNDNELVTLLQNLEPNGVEQYIELFDKSDAKTFMQSPGTSHETRKMRETMPAMTGPVRAKALTHLGTKTKVRIHPETKERQYLLHRGAGTNEYNSAVDGEGKIFHDHHTSWTPHVDVADSFAGDYNNENDSSGGFRDSSTNTRMSAWIPESKIKTIPMHTWGGEADEHPFAGEHEVVVGPHESDDHDFNE